MGETTAPAPEEEEGEEERQGERGGHSVDGTATRGLEAHQTPACRGKAARAQKAGCWGGSWDSAFKSLKLDSQVMPKPLAAWKLGSVSEPEIKD